AYLTTMFLPLNNFAQAYSKPSPTMKLKDGLWWICYREPDSTVNISAVEAFGVEDLSAEIVKEC
ncbi:hypothetical protein K7432_008941, partial [Basidiobolus ranarum]